AGVPAGDEGVVPLLELDVAQAEVRALEEADDGRALAAGLADAPGDLVPGAVVADLGELGPDGRPDLGVDGGAREADEGVGVRRVGHDLRVVGLAERLVALGEITEGGADGIALGGLRLLERGVAGAGLGRGEQGERERERDDHAGGSGPLGGAALTEWAEGLPSWRRGVEGRPKDPGAGAALPGDGAGGGDPGRIRTRSERRRPLGGP
ncbi:MAG: hypothetical protein ACK56F_00065, partial [bacterium]